MPQSTEELDQARSELEKVWCHFIALMDEVADYGLQLRSELESVNSALAASQEGFIQEQQHAAELHQQELHSKEERMVKQQIQFSDEQAESSAIIAKLKTTVQQLQEAAATPRSAPTSPRAKTTVDSELSALHLAHNAKVAELEQQRNTDLAELREELNAVRQQNGVLSKELEKAKLELSFHSE